ncbi:MAG: hypothetical protein F4117_03310 [Acidimicrobiales bacterium]|nr:hypothetical protein [Acidimicrobiaceae bacterium]MXV86433.1 hypothetical protein [Acidimicrobiales bacterium]MXX42802.1 hypothetical protein [Acidimicrobiales bacterium]MXZ13960.1 hypothetical protein [Acidimicrobiales bacterium]MYA81596.1 hypothetical protein [Acidimicrobiales bacterium]
MNTRTHPTRHKQRGDERGLTTLEWLLIVAAVAGLAALAVVLVQNVVDDTAEQLGGASARETAANVAADTVVREAKTAQPSDARFNSWQKWELYFTARCERLEILYSDTNLDVQPAFRRPTGKADSAAPSTAELNAADPQPATATKPQTDCRRAL